MKAKLIQIIHQPENKVISTSNKDKWSFEGKGSTESWREQRVKPKKTNKDNSLQMMNKRRVYPFKVKVFADEL